MTLLTIAAEIAKSVELEVPSAVVSNSDREWIEVLKVTEQAAEEIVRRVQWGQLTASTTLTGDGTNLTFTLPSGFSRIVRGVGVTASGGTVRPLTRAEWQGLTAAEGTPRYFLLEEDQITLFPYLASAATATVYYQTKNWCSSGGTTWAADTDTALIDEGLLAKGSVVRWRRQKGMDYADWEAEYEAALQDFAAFNDRSRL